MPQNVSAQGRGGHSGKPPQTSSRHDAGQSSAIDTSKIAFGAKIDPKLYSDIAEAAARSVGSGSSRDRPGLGVPAPSRGRAPSRCRAHRGARVYSDRQLHALAEEKRVGAHGIVLPDSRWRAASSNAARVSNQALIPVRTANGCARSLIELYSAIQPRDYPTRRFRTVRCVMIRSLPAGAGRLPVSSGVARDLSLMTWPRSAVDQPTNAAARPLQGVFFCDIQWKGLFSPSPAGQPALDLEH